jgi:hypothetical protein
MSFGARSEKVESSCWISLAFAQNASALAAEVVVLVPLSSSSPPH